MHNIQNNLIYSTFFAPRGRKRMYELGIQISQLFLSPFDKIIGIIGEPGSGKSVLVKGMFPGLELTNDDNGVNVRPLPLLEQDMETGFFSPHTYHVDIRFEMGFTQLPALADAVMEAVQRGKRVIVEHFDLLYPVLHRNADLILGVGEEIVIARPSIFGPVPQEVAGIVQQSLPYRLMAHTAEDLCEFCIPKEEMDRCVHGDIRHGFLLEFYDKPPQFDIPALEARVKDMIAQKLPITYLDENHISINGQPHMCTGPRTHVRNTEAIKGFRLLPYYITDPVDHTYLVAGCVGENSEEDIQKIEAMLST